jgi:hypothetical protein
VSARERWLVAAAGAAIACSGSLLADEQFSTAADLTAVLALHAKPCGKVVSATKNGNEDYVATCENGNRYRVYVKDARVVVDKVG